MDINEIPEGRSCLVKKPRRTCPAFSSGVFDLDLLASCELLYGRQWRFAGCVGQSTDYMKHPDCPSLKGKE